MNSKKEKDQRTDRHACANCEEEWKKSWVFVSGAKLCGHGAAGQFHELAFRTKMTVKVPKGVLLFT